MKIGLFSDSHYCKAELLCGTRRAFLSYKKIKEAMNAFKSENVDMVFCLGDLTDNADTDTYADTVCNFKEIISLIYSYNIPFYFVPGNHDYLMMSGKDIENLGNLRLPPYTVETDKYDFIVLDANYRENMERFDVAGVKWDDSNLPPKQVEYLKNALALSNKACIVLVHENLDPCVDFSHIIKNADEIRNIISSSGRVKLVLQGHYHWGHENTINSIPYITLPAMCEGDENPYRIIELN